MNKLFTLSLLAALTCGGCTAMGARDFYSKFPAATQSTYYSGAEAIVSINAQECIVLAADRFYAAPVGVTVYGDLNNGAEGVDGIVQNDGGNAYRIDSYAWVPYGYDGSTQLQIVFDTMLCKPADNLNDETAPTKNSI
jgi:hypothetical protein